MPNHVTFQNLASEPRMQLRLAPSATSPGPHSHAVHSPKQHEVRNHRGCSAGPAHHTWLGMCHNENTILRIARMTPCTMSTRGSSKNHTLVCQCCKCEWQHENESCNMHEACSHAVSLCASFRQLDVARPRNHKRAHVFLKRGLNPGPGKPTFKLPKFQRRNLLWRMRQNYPGKRPQTVLQRMFIKIIKKFKSEKQCVDATSVVRPRTI